MTDEEMQRAPRADPSPPAPGEARTPDAPSVQPAKPVAKLAVKIDDDPARLLGLTVKSLTQLLGAPRFTRRDPPAQLRRYRNKSCILDLFLYENPGQKPGSSVRHFETRSLSKTNMTARNCLRALLIARRPTNPG